MAISLRVLVVLIGSLIGATAAVAGDAAQEVDHDLPCSALCRYWMDLGKGQAPEATVKPASPPTSTQSVGAVTPPFPVQPTRNPARIRTVERAHDGGSGIRTIPLPVPRPAAFPSPQLIPSSQPEPTHLAAVTAQPSQTSSVPANENASPRTPGSAAPSTSLPSPVDRPSGDHPAAMAAPPILTVPAMPAVEAGSRAAVTVEPRAPIISGAMTASGDDRYPTTATGLRPEPSPTQPLPTPLSIKASVWGALAALVTRFFWCREAPSSPGRAPAVPWTRVSVVPTRRAGATA